MDGFQMRDLVPAEIARVVPLLGLSVAARQRAPRGVERALDRPLPFY